MSEQRLSQLMAEAAEDLGAPELAAEAWRQAGGVRRRRRVGASIGAFVAVTAVAVGVVATSGRDSPPPIPGTPTGPASISVISGQPVVEMPENPAYQPGLPLPRRIDVDAATVRPLSGSPVSRAVALYQPAYDPDQPKPGSVYALTPDGRWLALDALELEYTHDKDGNKFTPMRTNSLSPDGRYAAFPQPDAVVLVELATAGYTRLPLAGLNEHVVWSHDSRSLVVGGDQTVYRMDLTGTHATVRLSPWDVVAGRPSLGEMELSGGGQPEGGSPRPVTTKVWPSNGSAPVERQIDQSALGRWGVMEWYGRGWAAPNGEWLARSGWVHSGSVSGTEGVAVMRIGTDGVSMRRLLAFGMGEWKGCCETLGWLDDHTVLVRAQRFGLIRWDVTSGAVTRVTDPFLGYLALADLGRG
jgi:hypothetical protein